MGLSGVAGKSSEGYLVQGPTGGVDPKESGESLMSTLEKVTRELTYERERNKQLEEKILILEAEKKKDAQEVKRLHLLELKAAGLEEKNSSLAEEISQKDITLKKKQDETDECLLREKDLTRKYIELRIEKIRLEKKLIQEEMERIRKEGGDS